MERQMTASASPRTSITSQMVASGSYGIYPRNQRDRVMTVWHAERDGEYLGAFRTRDEAREAARSGERPVNYLARGGHPY